MSIFVIGDLHYQIDRYKDITEKLPYTVCVGDIGFNYNFLKDINPLHHVFNLGNHDNPQEALKWPHFLGHSGMASLNGIDFFFVRGAFSIDKLWRTPGRDWFSDEELNYSQSVQCIEKYRQTLPDIVIAHDFPADIIPVLFNPNPIFPPSNTQKLLQILIDWHKPKIFIGGHWHQSKNQIINDIQFVCLNELEIFELKEQLND